MNVAFVVPFRDKGTDPCRLANAKRVFYYLRNLDLGTVLLSDDGRKGDDPFNRSAAYNRGLDADHFDQRQRPVREWADVVVFYESDMIAPRDRLVGAIADASDVPGLVVPFTEYRALSPEHSEDVRYGADPAWFEPAHVMSGSMGAVNVVSRATLDAVGQWDECFEGHAYDDNAMERAFAVATGRPTRFIPGPAWHLWHIPGAGPTPGGADVNASEREKAATEANRLRWLRYQAATTPDQIRALTMEAPR